MKRRGAMPPAVLFLPAAGDFACAYDMPAVQGRHGRIEGLTQDKDGAIAAPTNLIARLNQWYRPGPRRQRED